jgi:HEAT repeat protein
MLITLAQREDRRLRSTALWALGEFGPLAASAVPVLVRALMDRDHDVRHAAFLSLAQIGPAASPARETVAWFARHGTFRWREVAEVTLRAIDRPHSEK